MKLMALKSFKASRKLQIEYKKILQMHSCGDWICCVGIRRLELYLHDVSQGIEIDMS